MQFWLRVPKALNAHEFESQFELSSRMSRPLAREAFEDTWLNPELSSSQIPAVELPSTELRKIVLQQVFVGAARIPTSPPTRVFVDTTLQHVSSISPTPCS